MSKSFSEEQIKYLEDIIGYHYRDKKLLNRVFTHKSVYSGNDIYNNYEQLEFLGDSLLGFVVADYLYTHYPLYNEGVMTVLRSKLVSRTPLSNIIKNLGNDASDDKLTEGEGIARFMRFGNGDYKTQLTEKVRCDLFESIVGSIYIDSGKDLKPAVDFILRNMETTLNTEVDSSIGDSKSTLQEYAQKKGLDVEYVMVNEEGPDHNKTFYYEVYVGGKLMGDGVGGNKKLAQQNAAKEALGKIK